LSAKRKLDKKIYSKRLIEFQRQLKGRKVTMLDNFTELAVKKQIQWNAWSHANNKVMMKLFKDFIGYDKNVESTCAFDPSTNYWDISAYRCYHIDKGIDQFLTDSMNLRFNSTQRQIQLSVSPKYKFMFEDELNLEILNKQAGIWRDCDVEDRPLLSFYDRNRL